MREQEMQVFSAKEAFRRGILRGNPVLMLCLGLFPAIMLATTLKAAAIVAVVSAVLLMIMELLTALVLKRLPFWLRIGIYALLSFGLLAGGLFACERFFPGFSGHAERLSATACGQCDDCVPLRNLRCASIPPCEPDGCAGRLPGLCDRVAAARICPRVVGKRLYFRTFFSNSTEDYGPIDALWRFFAAGLYGCRRKVDLSSAPFWRRGIGNSGCPCG